MSEAQVLETLSNTSGIDASLLVSKEGFVIEKAGRLDDVEVDQLGVTASELYSSAESLLGGPGQVEGLVFEAPDRRYLVSTVNDDVFLLVLARKKSNLGLLRLEARESAGKLKEL